MRLFFFDLTVQINLFSQFCPVGLRSWTNSHSIFVFNCCITRPFLTSVDFQLGLLYFHISVRHIGIEVQTGADKGQKAAGCLRGWSPSVLMGSSENCSVMSVFVASSSQHDSCTWSKHFAGHHLIHLLPLHSRKEGVIFNSLSVLLFWLNSCPTHTWLLHTTFLVIKVFQRKLAGALKIPKECFAFSPLFISVVNNTSAEELNGWLIY